MRPREMPAKVRPMGTFGELRDLSRLREIAVVMSRHGFAPAMQRIPLLRAFVGTPDLSLSKASAAERFARMLESLGPTFVKLGQILSTRGDLLPAAFITALSRLQDQVPPFPFAAVRTQIETQFGRPLEQVYAAFDETPLASASMAQVHAATLFTGEEVVVKVQRPGIADQVRGDAAILVVLARLLELVVEEASQYRASDLVAEFQAGLSVELDFTVEAKNLLAFSNFNHARAGVHVPHLYPDLSGRTVLTMERIRGSRISELKNDPPRAARLIERLVELAFDHVFIDGLFHGDPHPGNLLVTELGDIAFIDFGLVGRVTRDAQDKMLMLLLALSLKDTDTLCRLLLRLGAVEGRVELHAFRAAIGTLLDRYLGLSIAEISTASVLSDLVELSMRFGIRLPREFALLSKAVVAIEGIVRQLHPTFDPTKTLTTRAENLLLDRVDPRRLKGGGLRAALQIGMFFEELPLQVGQMLMDLERGNLQLNFKSRDLEGLDKNIRGLGMTIFSGLIASSLVLGGFYTLARHDFVVLGVQVLPSLAFGAAGVLTGGAFVWYVTGGKLPKIPLGRLLPRALQPRSREGES